VKVHFIQGDNYSTQVGTRFMKFYVEVHIFYESIYIVIKFINAAAEVYAG